MTEFILANSQSYSLANFQTVIIMIIEHQLSESTMMSSFTFVNTQSSEKKQTKSQFLFFFKNQNSYLQSSLSWFHLGFQIIFSQFQNYFFGQFQIIFGCTFWINTLNTIVFWFNGTEMLFGTNEESICNTFTFQLFLLK